MLSLGANALRTQRLGVNTRRVGTITALHSNMHSRAASSQAFTQHTDAHSISRALAVQMLTDQCGKHSYMHRHVGRTIVTEWGHGVARCGVLRSRALNSRQIPNIERRTNRASRLCTDY